MINRNIGIFAIAPILQDIVFGKDGAYPDGYYKQGSIDTAFTGYAVDTTQTNRYYYQGLPADGNYSTGYFNTGILDTTYTLHASSDNAVPSIDTNKFYSYTNGVAVLLANGLYKKGYITSGYYNSLINYATPQFRYQFDSTYFTYITGRAYLAGENTESPYSNGLFFHGELSLNDLGGGYGYGYGSGVPALDDDYEYIYIDGIPTYVNGLQVGDFGAFSFGYYNLGQDDIPVKSNNYINPTPQAVINNTCFYTFVNGNASLAEGKYSNGWFMKGVIQPLTYIIPTTAKDDSKYYTYVNGIPTTGNGAYTMYNLVNGEKVERLTPVTAIDASSTYYTYPQGEGMIAQGVFSNYAFFNGLINNSYNTTANNAITAQDTGNEVYYTYTNGTANEANGLFLQGYFSNGVFDVNYNTLTPVIASNSKWYIYSQGQPELAQGRTSVGYFIDGTLQDTYTNEIPGLVTDDTSYYIYLEGEPILPTGLFEVGYLLDGMFDIFVTTTLPEYHFGAFYLYENGEAILANGAYTNGYFTDGQFNETINDCIYQLGRPYKPEGIVINNDCFTDGYYVNGAIDTSVSLPDMQYVNGLYIFITNGLIYKAQGVYTSNSNVYYIDGVIATPQLDSGQFYTFADNNNKYYYANSSTTFSIPNGITSFGYFIDGFIDASVNINTPTLVSSTYYTYTNGLAVAASGLYIEGAFENGQKNTSYNASSPQAVLNSDFLYTFENGNAFLYVAPGFNINGAYSTGYYYQGNATQHTTYTPITAQDNKKYYTYFLGQPTIATGPQKDGWYHGSSSGIDVNYTSSDIHTVEVGSAGYDSAGAWLYIYKNYITYQYINGLPQTISQPGLYKEKLLFNNFNSGSASEFLIDTTLLNSTIQNFATNVLPKTAINDPTTYYYTATSLINNDYGTYINNNFSVDGLSSIITFNSVKAAGPTYEGYLTNGKISNTINDFYYIDVTRNLLIISEYKNGVTNKITTAGAYEVLNLPGYAYYVSTSAVNVNGIQRSANVQDVTANIPAVLIANTKDIYKSSVVKIVQGRGPKAWSSSNLLPVPGNYSFGNVIRYIPMSLVPTSSSAALDITYNNLTPTNNYIDYSTHPTKPWVIYTSGVAVSANGMYFQGYFVNGSYGSSTSIPMSAKNVDYLNASIGPAYLIFTNNGVSQSIQSANGAYSNGYFGNRGTAGGRFLSSFNTAIYNVTQAIDTQKYYIYTNGIPALATGQYVQGYFVDGLFDQTQTNATPSIFQNIWYIYHHGVPTQANGIYTNGKYVNGNKTTPYIAITPVLALDTSLYYIFTTDSTSTLAPDGLYSNHALASGDINHSFTTNTPASAIDKNNRYYTYTNGNAVSANGIYSTGKFIYSVPDLSYSSSLPVSAIDTELYYIYANGVGTIAVNGPYSNYALYQGSIDTSYTSNIPVESINISDRYFTYINGLATQANGSYTTGRYVNSEFIADYTSYTPVTAIDDSAKHYIYIDGESALANGAFKTVAYYLGSKDTSFNTTIPITAIDDNVHYYSYTNGNAVTASGVYSTGIFSYGEILAPVNNILPVSAIDTQKYYTYINNIFTFAQGAYSTYYFNNGDISTTFNGYVIAQDTSKMYKYTQGIAQLFTGNLSTGPYASGQINYFFSTGILGPVTAVDTGLYYKYYWGIPYLANGPYTPYYFSSGEIDFGFNSATPIQVDNSEILYTFTNGVATPDVCYTDKQYYLNNEYGQPHSYNSSTGKRITYSPETDSCNEEDLTGIAAADDTGLFYNFDNIPPTVANGLYRSGYYLNGIPQTIFYVNSAYSNNIPNNNILDLPQFSYYGIDASIESYFGYFVYDANGAGQPPAGYYSNGIFASLAFNGTPEIGSFIIFQDPMPPSMFSVLNTILPYNNLPVKKAFIAVDNNKAYRYFNENLEVIYPPTLFTGFLSTGYYLNGVRAAYSGDHNDPHLCKDTDSLYCVYDSAGNAAPANGFYSLGCFVDGYRTVTQSMIDNYGFYVGDRLLILGEIQDDLYHSGHKILKMVFDPVTGRRPDDNINTGEGYLLNNYVLNIAYVSDLSKDIEEGYIAIFFIYAGKNMYIHPTNGSIVVYVDGVFEENLPTFYPYTTNENVVFQRIIVEPPDIYTPYPNTISYLLSTVNGNEYRVIPTISNVDSLISGPWAFNINNTDVLFMFAKHYKFDTNIRGLYDNRYFDPTGSTTTVNLPQTGPYDYYFYPYTGVVHVSESSVKYSQDQAPVAGMAIAAHIHSCYPTPAPAVDLYVYYPELFAGDPCFGQNVSIASPILQPEGGFSNYTTFCPGPAMYLSFPVPQYIITRPGEFWCDGTATAWVDNIYYINYSVKYVLANLRSFSDINKPVSQGGLGTNINGWYSNGIKQCTTNVVYAVGLKTLERNRTGQFECNNIPPSYNTVKDIYDYNIGNVVWDEGLITFDGAHNVRNTTFMFNVSGKQYIPGSGSGIGIHGPTGHGPQYLLIMNDIAYFNKYAVICTNNTPTGLLPLT